MIKPRSRRPLLAAASCLLALGACSPAVAVDLSNLTTILSNTASGGWSKVNLNTFADAFPAPADLTSTGFDNPVTVITAWSSFAWDSQRGQLMLYGGGHANYAGNEMYLWSGVTQSWDRGSLPSQVTGVNTPNGVVYLAVDGALNAPTSMHTYDNSMYLRVADRFITLGGPTFNSSNGPVKQLANGSLVATGPYLWDPSRANATQVGGTTGSAVNPAVTGGQMWQNRDVSAALFNVTTFAGTFALATIDGTSVAAVEGGRDVVYFTGRAAGSQYLMKYSIVNSANPALDTISIVGSTVGGPGAYGAAGLDPASGFYVSLAETGGLMVYDTHAANGASNSSSQINFTISGAPAFDGSFISGIDWDPTRQVFMIWSGAGDVWRLTTPASGNAGDIWSLALVTNGDNFANGATPDGMDPSGVRGKWKYISNLDAFLALESDGTGEVWLYRPDGWVNPVPEPGMLAFILLGLGVVVLRVRQLRRAAPH